MKVKKAFQFLIYPNKSQITLINKTIGCARFVYNYFVGKQKEKDTYWYIVNEMVQNGQLLQNNWTGEFFNKNKAVKAVPALKNNFPFLKEVDSIALQKAVENVNDSYTRYYKKQKRAPLFKSKKHPVQSYTTKYVNGNIAVMDKHIKLPKLGHVRLAETREVEGRLINVTGRQKPSCKYFVSVLVEIKVGHHEKPGSSVGIDVGLKDFATLPEETVYEDPRVSRTVEEKLARA